MVDEGKALSPFGSFLFPHIFRSFRMAIQPSRLALAFAAVTAICLTGRLMDLNPTVVVTSDGPFPLPQRLLGPWPHGGATELDAYLRSGPGLRTFLSAASPAHARAGVFITLWNFAGNEIQTATTPLLIFDVSRFASSLVDSIHRCIQALVWAFKYHTIYSVVFFTIVLIVLSMAGGAICRLNALQFALGKRVGLRQGWRFARTRLVNFAAAPITPLIVALLLGLPIILLGALGNIPYAGELLTALLLPLALILAPGIAVILVGAAAGLNLLAPAIAFEDSDYFDAVGRAASNVYAKPWRMGFYTLVAAVYGAACYLFVRLFALLVLWLTRGFLQIGLADEKLQAIWPEPSFGSLLGTAASAPETWSLWLAALLIRIWVLGVAGLVVSFVLSFYFTAGTIIYALMRNRVDGTPLDEVYEAPEETTPGSSSPAEDREPAVAPDQAGQTTATSE